MNRATTTVLFSVIALGAANHPALAVSVTTALLTVGPVPVASLRVSVGTTNADSAGACLDLDLEPIRGAGPTAITSVVLRVQGTAIGGLENSQLVRVFEAKPDCSGAKDTTSLASWTIRRSGEQALATGPGLRDAVAGAIKTSPSRLRLYVQSETPAANWEYGSLSRPRLIVTYDVADSTTVTSGQTIAWTFFSSGTPIVDAKRIYSGLNQESDDPLLYRDDVVVIADGKLQRLSTSGALRWSVAVAGDLLGKWSAIDGQGRFYNFGSDSNLRVFDLDAGKPLLPPVAFPGMALESGLTIAPGGNLYFATSGTSAAIFGWTPFTSGAPPQELWRSGTTGAGATRVVISPPGPDFMAYALANEGFFAIDAATGVRTRTGRWDVGVTKAWSRTDPVVGRGPAHDYVVLAASGDAKGVARAWSQTRSGSWYWDKPVIVSQPAIASATEPRNSRVVAIAGGRFTRASLLTGASLEARDKDQLLQNTDGCSSADSTLAATSNILLDGQSNAYFWNNGRFYIYASDCTRVLEQAIPGLAQRLTLRFAPDGTVITKSGSELFALQRRVPVGTLTLRGSLADRTAYVANAIQVAPGAMLPPAARVILRARDRVAFGPGFRVAAGAALSVQIQ